jgi:hypothetical protein
MATIKIVRDVFPRERDFKVLIDGEHRASFRSRKRYSQIGYDFEAPDGKPIARGNFRGIVKADFDPIVRKCLAEIPSRTLIDRALMIEQAHKENRERDDAINKRKAEVREQVYRVAMARYLNNPASPEHAKEAAHMFNRVWGF